MANEEILELQIRDNAATAAASLSDLATSLTKVKEAIGKGLRLQGAVNALESLKTAVTNGLTDESVNRFERLADAIERLKQSGNFRMTGVSNLVKQLNVSDPMTGVAEKAQGAMGEVTDAVDRGMEQVEARIGNASKNMQETPNLTKAWFSDIIDGFKGVKAEGEQSGKWQFFNSLGESLRNASAGIGKLISDFGRIVKYRAIRSIIKQITSAFSTGIEDMYHYSKAIGSTFATDMDSAASSLLKFKNSIGAACAPLIQQMIPYLQTIINYVIEGINYLNQFLALMNGQSTWTKAIDATTTAYKDNKKAAKSAKGSIKELLADWDELNIIQSESGSGGGGSSKKEQTDYTKMFEEVSEFSKYIKDHFNEIQDVVKGIGVALAAWGLSKKFTGWLSKLARFVAGGALVAIGLELSYGAGFDAGAKGEWNTIDIAKAVIGGLATAIGGHLIATSLGLSGVAGFGIGLTVAAIVTLVGYIKGQNDLKDRRKWGNLTMTQDQIEKFVKSQFTFDVDAEVTILDGVIQNEKTAIANLNEKITTFKNSLTDATIQAGISVDSTETGAAVTKAAADARDAITAVEGLLKRNNEGINVLIKTFKFTDADGNDISKDLLTKINVADKTVESYFTDIGRQLAHWVTEGETKGWNEDITKSAIALMQREQKILEEAQRYSGQFEFETKTQLSFKNVIDRDTAQAQFDYQKQLLEDTKNKEIEALKTQAESAFKIAGIAQGEADDALEQAQIALQKNDQKQYDFYMNKRKGLLESVETYKTEAESSLKQIENIDERFNGTIENMRKEWAKTLAIVYGDDFAESVNYATEDKAHSGLLWNALGIGGESDNKKEVKRLLAEGGITKVSEWLNETLKNALIADDPNGIVSYVLNEWQGNVYDFLTDEMKKQLFQNMTALFDGDQIKASEVIQQAFGLEFDDISDEWAKYFEDPDAIDPAKAQPSVEMEEPTIINEQDSKKWIDKIRTEFASLINQGTSSEFLVHYLNGEIGMGNGGVLDEALSQFNLEDLGIKKTEVGFEVILDAKVENVETLKQEIADQIESAMSDGVMTDYERQHIIDRFGEKVYQQMLEELQWNLDENGTNMGKNIPKTRYIAAAGVSDVSFKPAQTVVAQTTNNDSATAEQLANKVESGMRTANEPQNDILRQIYNGLITIARKDWTINVNPSTDWGMFNKRSDKKREMVTGGEG